MSEEHKFASCCLPLRQPLVLGFLLPALPVRALLVPAVLALPTLSIIIIINIMANFASASFKRLFNLDFDLANNLCRVIKQLDKSENDRWGSQRGSEGVCLVIRLCNNIADLFCTGRHSGANIMCHFMGQVYSARLSVAIILDRADCTRRH